jgi:hypothetical protein
MRYLGIYQVVRVEAVALLNYLVYQNEGGEQSEKGA